MGSDEKTCPRCAETIKAAAKVCRFCGHEFGGTYQPSRAERRQAEKADNQGGTSSTGRAVGIGCLVLLGLAFVGSVVGGSDQPNTTNASESAGNEVLAVGNLLADSGGTGTVSEQPASDWSTSSEQDEIRGKAVHYATVTSENETYFDFPYNGGSKLTMTVRRHPKYGDDVIFQISKGQFVCRMDDCSGTINYGGGPQTISLNEPADYDHETLFAAAAPSVIKHLKGADKVIVELPFFQEGNRQFTFKTHGLVWPPRDAVTK